MANLTRKKNKVLEVLAIMKNVNYYFTNYFFRRYV